MLKWAHSRVRSKRFSNKVDAKVEFRCCMDRLTRDLKLYRIAPQDLIKVKYQSIILIFINVHIAIYRGNANS